MFYMNFDSHITLKYGIVLEGWPSDVKFAAPGHINSLPELQILYTAWETGKARFRSLSNSEWRDWISRYNKKHDANAPVSDDEDNENDQNNEEAGQGAATSSVPCGVPPIAPTSSTALASSTLPPSASLPLPSMLPSSPAPTSSAPPSFTASAVPPSSAPPLSAPPSGAPPSFSMGVMPVGASCAPSSSAQLPPSSHAQSPSPAPLTSVQPVSAQVAPGTSTGGTRKRPRSDTLTFLHAVTTDNGTGIIVPKRQRKERSDKNTKRGPRKKRVTPNENENENENALGSNAPSPAS
ncbi:hypothetical protein GY45DRAFT_1340412 [Cubamyces sp. BRFM 1775]|nr:hypothetical protein GY45DRAFT_1340412 [Cubamyces sp. BRFM 1775]